MPASAPPPPTGLKKIARDIFGRGTSASIAAVRDNLWTASIAPETYAVAGEKYQAAVLEQYKMYVEMADRISSRRALANTFFLTLNTAVFTAIGLTFADGAPESRWIFAFPLVVLLGQCAAWFWLVRSYRQLNTAKFIVVGALEEKLPASPFWRAEWQALGEGMDKSRYWPLTHLEQWVPLMFGTVYLVGFAVLVAS